jgi:hypothetical protein
MEEPARIVVSLPDGEASTGDVNADRLLVTLPETITISLDQPSGTEPRRPTRRSKKVVVALVVLLLVGAAAVGAYVAIHRAAPPNPLTVTLPGHLSQATATRAYLTGPGSRLVGLVNEAPALGRQKSNRSCNAFASHKLDPLGSPSALLLEADGVPNPAVRAALLNELNAVATYVGDCSSQHDLSDSRTDLRFTTIIAERFLARIHVTSSKETLA